MANRTPTRTNALLLVALLFVQFLLMAGSLTRNDGTTVLQDRVGRATEPLVRTSSRVGGTVFGSVKVLPELRTARGEVSRLQDEVRRLRSESERSREAALENERLRRLLQMRERLVPKSIGATVITTQLAGQSRMIVVDRGTSDGVAPDQGVVAWGGALGRVVSASRHFATVRLLSDPNSGVSGLVQRSRAEGMVLGRGDGPFELAYVPKFSDVEVGDRIVTSGLDGVFPKGFGVGRVVSVAEGDGASLAIRIEPEIDPGAVEEVLVLLEPTGTSLLEPPPEPSAAPLGPRADR